MKCGKIILAALVITIVGAVYGGLTCGWLFGWVYELPPTSVWVSQASMTGMFWVWTNLGTFILNIILVYVFALLYEKIPGKGIKKGLCFGLIIWAVATLPGMFATHMFMTVNSTVVIYWVISHLVWYPIAGLLIALIYKK